MKNLQAAPAFQLIDVNSNFLKVQGSTDCEFFMGSLKFQHNFIIFESLKNEILIGNNFFLAQKIAIYPSIGLLSNHQTFLKSISCRNRLLKS